MQRDRSHGLFAATMSSLQVVPVLNFFFPNHDQIFFGTFDQIVGECKNLLAKNQADMNG
jgi:hypothetical protein